MDSGGRDTVLRPGANISRRSALRRIGAGMAATAGVAGTGGAIAAQDATPAAGGAGAGLKILLHVSDDDGWVPADSNLTNLTRDYPAAEIRVVVDGSGVYAFQGASDVTAKLEAFSRTGVDIRICANALRDHQIDPQTLPAYAHLVPAGVIDLVESQNAGFRYVKP